VLDGTVIGRCMQRHRHSEFIRFLNAVEREVPAGELIHAVLDNYATHKHPKVLAWLSRHPRWIFHFTPTSASWLNAVENFFSKMTRQRIRRGVFRSIVGSAGPGSRPGASMSTKGYRGHNHAQRFRVWISGQVRRATAPIRREMHHRAAVEPVIGHVKAEHWISRN
jgi:DDE superfamily endonuclease